MTQRLHHFAITTPDLSRLLTFYRDLLGFEEISRTSWAAGSTMINRVLGLQDCAGTSVMLNGGNLCLELFEFDLPKAEPRPEPRPVSEYGFTHFCLDVVGIDEVYQRLCVAGIHFHCPPQDFGVAKATYGRDPDGNVFELQEVLSN